MRNVDELEIKKFENLASRWWDPNSEFKPLHDINPLRINYISRMLNLAEKSVLDIGCGGGILAEGLTHHGAHVTAIDMAEASLSVAKLHQYESNLDIDYRFCLTIYHIFYPKIPISFLSTNISRINNSLFTFPRNSFFS